ncbi:MAG TPA: DUF1839 family protein [Azospirillum sp.]|nr:DUF1839 family protein [Azospirillum sp.]
MEHRPHPLHPHTLHGPDRAWPETNCYVDLWIELLHAWGFEPRATLGFTVAQDFEGDQFTFFKPPPEDLRALFGIEVQELAIYDTVEAHAAVQLRLGRSVLVEVDSFHLPDTRGTAYGTQHVKTTIAILGLDAQARCLDYIHNAGRFTLEGADYDGVFRRLPHLRDNPNLLFPYVEFVRRSGSAPAGRALLDTALDLLGQHVHRRPEGNPVATYRAEFPRHLETLAARPMEYFHLYAFNVLRQLGANMELLGSHLRWLGEGGLDEAAEACDTLATTAKVLQFQLARAVRKRGFGDYTASLDAMERAYDTAVGALARRFG